MVAYDERSGYRERLLKAEAELDEARAQIAAKDAEISNLRAIISSTMHEALAIDFTKDTQIAAREEEFNVALTDLGNENLDLKAQIAAKDAALDNLKAQITAKDALIEALETNRRLREERAALAAPARSEQ